jgi:two-component system sensor histidine kinase YesM
MSAETLAKVRETMVRGPNPKGGIGLSNTNKRLQLLFGKRFGMRIESEQGKGTEVVLTIPMLLVEKR